MSTSESDPEFEALLAYLKQNCGYDLTGYKRASLMRRFQRRMQQLKIENYRDYWQYLQGHAQECTSLLDTILINVSDFFRDRDTWNYLADKIIPQIITNKQAHERIRIWSAGCASGEEVYTLAMLLAESLGIKQYLQRVQILATDVDEDALMQARQGSYSDNELAAIPSELRSKYFEKTHQSYVFCSKLRRTIIFGRHDLTVHAPMSKIDLLVCRNVLIYFKPETQANVLLRFHFALADQGFLCLGNSESLSNNRRIYNPVSLKYRIFAKGQDLSLEDHLRIKPQTGKKKAVNPLTTQFHIWQTAFETSPYAQLAVDRNGYLLMANEQAYIMFGLENGDLGKRLQNLEMGQLVNVFTVMRQLDRDWGKSTNEGNHQSLNLKNIKWVHELGTTYLDIHIKPISDSGGRLLGANLIFIDVTQYTHLVDEFESLSANLARVTQELHYTLAQLSTTNAELESTQKELECLHQEILERTQGGA
jgi:two-component system CheB/CheR fusion protein